jgi:flagellar basal-body rod protein FlgC
MAMWNTVSAREIAVSGLRAQRVRMNVISNNISNAFTTRTPEGGAFRRQLAVFQAGDLKTTGSSAAGVRVTKVMGDTTPLRSVYDPFHPDAGAEGYVEYPNVNLAIEMADLVSAQRAYEANVAVLASGRKMTQKALEIIQA